MPSEPEKIVVVNLPVLVLTWPGVPDPTGQVELKDGKVLMTQRYWEQIVKYFIDIDKNRGLYEYYKSECERLKKEAENGRD